MTDSRDHAPTAVVTGAAGGVGGALLSAFRNAGYLGGGGGRVAALLAASRNPGYRVTGVDRVAADGVTSLDVTDTAAVAAFAASIDTLDALINAAGVLRLLQENDPGEFAGGVRITLTGPMRMAVACRPALAKARGSIVNIASMHAIFGAPLSPAYAASKAGVVQLTKSLAVAWAEDGIRVNAIAPGWIATPMTTPARSHPARPRATLAPTH